MEYTSLYQKDEVLSHSQVRSKQCTVRTAVLDSGCRFWRLRFNVVGRRVHYWFADWEASQPRLPGAQIEAEGAAPHMVLEHGYGVQQIQAIECLSSCSVWNHE